MNNWTKDIITGVTLTSGILGFLSGEFIISSTLFASATLMSNIHCRIKNDH